MFLVAQLMTEPESMSVGAWVLLGLAAILAIGLVLFTRKRQQGC
jgi:LPXTG-motif cell wall-anchored protein